MRGETREKGRARKTSAAYTSVTNCYFTLSSATRDQLLMNFSLNRRTMGELSKGPSRRVRPEPEVQSKRETKSMFFRGHIGTTVYYSPRENVLAHWKFFHHRPCTEGFFNEFFMLLCVTLINNHLFLFQQFVHIFVWQKNRRHFQVQL